MSDSKQAPNTSRVLNINVGVLGHVDSGKTSLGVFFVRDQGRGGAHSHVAWGKVSLDPLRTCWEPSMRTLLACTLHALLHTPCNAHIMLHPPHPVMHPALHWHEPVLGL